jgi:hypothetical protein
VAVRCCDATTSSIFSKFPGEVFAHFHAVAIKRHSSMQNQLFGLSGRIFVNIPLDIKENDEHALDFALQMSRLFFFRSTLNQELHSFFPERLSNQYQCLRRTFSDICTNFDASSLSGPRRNRIRPDTQLQIKRRKKSAHPASCVKFYILTPKIC